MAIEYFWTYWVALDLTYLVEVEHEFIHDLQSLLAESGLLKTKSQARKSFNKKDIPNGFTDFIRGKLKNRGTILKIID